LAAFRKLLPFFKKTKLAHLQGWGEPLLHPDFFTMAALAKDAGCRVGTTSNGMLLDPVKIRQTVALGLDFIALSLAGGSAPVHDHFRRGTSFHQILEVLDYFRRIKADLGSLTPEIHIAYLLLRSGWPDLERLPLVLEGFGVREVVISTLDFVPAGALSGEEVTAEGWGDYEEMRVRLQMVAAAGAARGLQIRHNLRPPGAGGPACTENPGRGLVVAADGGVSPCVFANLPPGISRFAGGRELSYQPLIFGNINRDSLEDIWHTKNYAAFREGFRAGKVPAHCRACAKISVPGAKAGG
jgi:MoaA/NifB/PqqE/SkfB family radical SAM enzyme